MDHKIWTNVVIWVNVGGILRVWLFYNFVSNTRYKICLLLIHGSWGRSPYKPIHSVIYIYIYIYIYLEERQNHKNNNYYNNKYY